MKKLIKFWNSLSKTIQTLIKIAGGITVLLILLEKSLNLSDRLKEYLDRPPPNTEQQGGGR